MSARLANLLRKINQGEAASVLQNDGELLYQVAHLISQALGEDLIKYDEDKRLKLTGAGRHYLYNADRQREGGTKGWIDPADDERQPQLARDAIYIPNKSVISKLRRR